MRRIRVEKLRAEGRMNRAVRRVFRKQAVGILGAVTTLPLASFQATALMAIDKTKSDLNDAYKANLLPLMRRRAREVFKTVGKKNEQSIFDSFLFNWVDEHVRKK